MCSHMDIRRGHAVQVYMEFDFTSPKRIVILFPRELQGLKVTPVSAPSCPGVRCWLLGLPRGHSGLRGGAEQ